MTSMTDQSDGAFGSTGAGFTPGPWEYIPATEHHGAYVVGPYGGDICDCYAMSKPAALSTLNGGDSKPIAFMDAEANARLIAAAPCMYEALAMAVAEIEAIRPNVGARQSARLGSTCDYLRRIMSDAAAIALATGAAA